MRKLGLAAAIILTAGGPQDRPTPPGYLEVTEWWGTFSVTLHHDETTTESGTTVNNRVRRSCSGSFHLDSRHTGGNMPTQGGASRSLGKREGANWTQSGNSRKATTLAVIQNESRVASFFEKGEAGAPSTGGERKTWKGQGNAKPIYDDYTLVVDVKNGTYGLHLPFETIATHEIKSAYAFRRWRKEFDGRVTGEMVERIQTLSSEPGPALTVAKPGRLGDLKLPAGGVADLQGNLTYEGLMGRGMKKPAKVVVSWFLSPRPPEDVELVLEPENAVEYEAWRPLGSTSEQVPGAHLGIKATLQVKNGGVPRIKARNITFRLNDVTQEPGVCINYPFIPIDRDAPDLKFWLQTNMSMTVPNDLQAIQHGPHLTQATVVVSSFDFGAAGEISATAILENGRELWAVVKNDPGWMALRIPNSREGSKIAKSWRPGRKSQGEDDSDEDDFPLGDGNKGDGVSLYEEYRGFMQKEAWSDLNPDQKDFFIIDQVNGDAKAGYRRFEELSDLKVHHDLTDQDTKFKVVNFNYSAGRRHVDQHAVRVTCWANETESAAQGGPGRPKDIHQVVLAGGGGPGERDYPAYKSIIHELFHCCSVWHHGDHDRREFWMIESKEGRRRASRLTPDGKLEPIKLFRESDPGTEIDVPGSEEAMDVIIGTPNSQNSGEETCVLRYTTAVAYEKAPLQYYFVPFSDGTDVGTTLCWGPEGHTFNKLSRKDPRPRYYSADAACRRGNCRGQICVNDGVVIDRRECRPSRHPKDPK